MRPDIRLDTTTPTAYRTLLVLNDECRGVAASAGLDPMLVGLVRIRASQINGCAFCLRYYVREAIANGESADRIGVLPAWRDTRYFSPQERAALVVAERTTLVADAQARLQSDSEEDAALSDEQVAAVRWLTIATNALNRVATTSRLDVTPAGVPRPHAAGADSRLSLIVMSAQMSTETTTRVDERQAKGSGDGAAPAEGMTPLALRVRGEYREMPGLRLTVRQAARLFGVAPDVAGRVLDELRHASVLARSDEGTYALPGESSRRRASSSSAHDSAERTDYIGRWIDTGKQSTDR